MRNSKTRFKSATLFIGKTNSLFSFICALTPYLFNRLVFVRGAFLIKAEILSVFDNNFISRRVFIFAICFILSVFTLNPSISPNDSISAFVASVTKSISENTKVSHPQKWVRSNSNSFFRNLVGAKQLIYNGKKEAVTEAKISKLDELTKVLSVKKQAQEQLLVAMQTLASVKSFGISSLRKFKALL